MMFLIGYCKFILNFLFFKAFNCRFFLSDLSSLFFILFPLLLLSFVAVLFLSKIFYVSLKEFFLFFKMLYFNFLNSFFRYFVSFLLELILFTYRCRFFFFVGSSYHDPLTKIFFDNLSSLKGEFLMDFYNFSNKYLFENDYNVPLSIFNKTPIFDSSKNVFFIRTFSQFFISSLESQIKIRSFFFFRHKIKIKKTFLPPYNSTNEKYIFSIDFDHKSIWFVSLEFFSMRFFSFLMNFFSKIELIEYYLQNLVIISFFKICLTKYFTILKNSFIFILFNLETDSFMHYLHVTLYRLALQRYYNKDDWKNLINTYDFSITNSAAFSGDKTGDLSYFFKVTFSFAFIYLNFFVYCFLFFSFVVFWVFYYFFNLLLHSLLNANNSIFFSDLLFIFNFLDLTSLYFNNAIYSLFTYSKHFHFSLMHFFFRVKKNFLNLIFFYFFDFLTVFYVSILYLLYLFRLFWTIFLNFFHNFIGTKAAFDMSRQLFASFFILSFYGYSVLNEKKDFLFSKSFMSYQSSLPAKYNQKKVFDFKLFQEFFYFKLFNMYFSGFIKASYSRFSLIFRLLFFRIFFYFFFWSSLFDVKYNSLSKFSDKELYLLFKRKKLFFFLNLIFDFFFSLYFYYFDYFFLILKFLFSRRFFKNFLNFFSFCISFLYITFSNFAFIFLHLFFLFFFYLKVFLIMSLSGFFLFFLIMFIFPIFLNVFLLKIFFVCFFIPLLLFFYKSLIFFRFKTQQTTFFYSYISLIFSIFIRLFLFYKKTLQFLHSRDIGFFQILSIFFLIRNDLKKYEIMHSLTASNLFNSISVDFFLNNFFLNCQRNFLNVFEDKFKFQKKDSLDFLDFSKSKAKMNVFYHNLKIFPSSKDKYRYLDFKSDLFSEFEYHKFLRSRNLRNLKTFRFKKAVEPLDLFNDFALDDMFPYFPKNSSSSNFDFLRIFYNDDSMFLKDLKYFRRTFSRRNLSFFYDNLDRLSNFRLRYNKVSPLFRYFYLKRERFKYILTLYANGNINNFSFSIVSNWLLNYRILRAILKLISNSDYTFIHRSISYKSKYPKFSLFFFLSFFDKFFYFFNFVFFFFFFLIFLLISYFVFFNFYICLSILFLFSIYIMRNFFFIYNLNILLPLFYTKPFLINIKALIIYFFSSFFTGFKNGFFFSQKLFITNFGNFFKLFILLLLTLFLFFFVNYQFFFFFPNFVDFNFLCFIHHQFFIAHFFFGHCIVLSFFISFNFASFAFICFHFFFLLLLFKFFLYKLFTCFFFRIDYIFLNFFLVSFLVFPQNIYPYILLKEIDLLIHTSVKENLHIRKIYLKN